MHTTLTVQAIRWAIDKNVHIISMSWTIHRTQDNDTGFKELTAAIKEAQDAKILMFGAASDQGFNSDRKPFPAKASGVICIGAAKWSGHVEEAAERDADYVFPGGTFMLPQTQSNRDEQPQQVSGSSFATALASGLTALILYCVEISSLPPDPPQRSVPEQPSTPEQQQESVPEQPPMPPPPFKVDGEHRRLLQNHEIIKAIFSHIAQREGPVSSKYIAANRVFGRSTWEEKNWVDSQVRKEFYESVEYIIRHVFRYAQGGDMC